MAVLSHDVLNMHYSFGQVGFTLQCKLMKILVEGRIKKRQGAELAFRGCND